jgi:hypothetical protein
LKIKNQLHNSATHREGWDAACPAAASLMLLVAVLIGCKAQPTYTRGWEEVKPAHNAHSDFPECEHERRIVASHNRSSLVHHTHWRVSYPCRYEHS